MKENRAFRSYSFLAPKNSKRSDRLCMEFSWSSNTSAQRCLNPLFQRILFLLSHLFLRISQKQQVRIKIMVNSVDYHPCPWRLASRFTSFHISKNFSRALSLTRILLDFLSNFYIPLRKIFKLPWMPWKYLGSRDFYSCRKEESG